MKAMGGAIQAKLAPQGRGRAPQGPRRRATTSTRVLHTDDLVAGDNTFFVATGITDGDLLRGVRYTATGAQTRVDRDALQAAARSGRCESTHVLEKVRRSIEAGRS